MLRSIDHIVVLVRKLSAAIADYERIGFTVTPGGEHAGGATHNALIPLADGTYFELIAFKEPDRPQEHKWWPRLAQGEGLVDFALLSDDLGAEAAALRERGVDARGPVDGGRLRPDGQRVAWHTLNLGATPGRSALPFLIDDVTPRELRVPGGDAARHALSVERVAGLTIVVADLAATAATYEALLGQGVRAGEPGGSSAPRSQRFQLGRQWLELLQPAESDVEAARYLRQRGEGPFEVVLGGEGEGRDGSAGELLTLDATHGARVRVLR